MSFSGDHYDAEYFEWQKVIGKFGGKANTFKFKESVGSNDTVLDFGCGGGFLLASLNCKKKLDIEVNSSAHPQIKENSVIPYSSAKELLEAEGQECVDIIISNNALEHTLNPLLELIELFPLLKKGAKLHFVVPCDNISYKWKSNDINFHLYSWSPMNLGNLFVQAGYKVIKTKPLIHKWPPQYQRIQKLFGWKIFHLACYFWGRVDRSWYQVEIIAEK